MKTSVIIPVFNGEKTIRETIEAVLAQTVKPDEIIVVDDGSSDKTVEIVKKYPVKLIMQQNAGPAAARNRGAKASIDDIIIFTDADCVPPRDWLEQITKPFKDPKVGGVGGCYETLNKDNVIARFVGEDIRYRHKRLKREVDTVGSYSLAFRRSAFKMIGGFDETYKRASAEDWDISYRAIQLGFKLIYEPKAIVGHRHSESISEYLKKQFWHAVWRVKLYEKHKTRARGDSYTKITTLLQPPLTGFFLFSLILLPSRSYRIVPLLFFSLFILATLPLFKFTYKKDIHVAVGGILIQSVRNIVWFFGLIYGIFKKNDL